MRIRAVPRVRRRIGLSLALVLGAAFLIPATSSFGATGTISVVDYSQCANGTGTDLDCHVQGWINGIMQKSNSHFQEGDVTPQRAIVTVSGSGTHSIQLKYQARKGTTHAYDSLATWNHTVTGADRCLSLIAAVQTAINCGVSTPTSTWTIPDDPTIVSPFTSVSGATSAHDLDAQQIQLFSANGAAALTGMTVPGHDHNTCPGKCADDYATTKISFTAPAGSTVEILFGGHLAVSPANRGGWGAGLGASNINGGPYHIKWDAADGGSVGNRDNQITGGDIQALAEPGLSTTANPTSATIGTAVTLTDKVTLAGATDPTGTTTFTLWGPYGASDTPTCGTDSNVSEASVLSASTSTYTKTLPVGTTTGLGTWEGTGTASSHTFLAGTDGDYYWVASTAADANNTAAGPDGCGDASEKVTVSKAAQGGSTAIVLDDTVTVTGDGTHTPTGKATFSLWDGNASSCGTVVTDPVEVAVWGPTEVDLDSTGTDAVATAGAAYTTDSGHTYYWRVTYSGDTIYDAATISDCTEAAAVT